MNKKIIGILVFIVVAIAVGAFYWVNTEVPMDELVENGNREQVTQETVNSDIDMGGITYYYGEGCPHCKSVLIFLDEFDVYSKVDFEKKEVWKNKENSQELAKVAQKCGINPKSIGVPFLAAHGKCYVGLPDVKNFFKKEIGMLKK
ncbi:glutaredoxin domain-containing protein [Patescibacteria group bacterium]